MDIQTNCPNFIRKEMNDDMSADNNLMRLVAVSPVHIGDLDAQTIHRIFRQFVAQEKAAGDKSRLMGENVRLDDQGEITLLFGQFYNDPRDLAQDVLDVIHNQPRDYSDTLVADEMKAKVRPGGGYTFLDDTPLFPKDERQKSQPGSLGDPRGIATSVAQAYGSQFATSSPMTDDYQQTSAPDIATVARKGQSMYQTQTPQSSQSAASVKSTAAAQTAPATDQSQAHVATPSSSAVQKPARSEDDTLLDEIMPDADSIINSAMNPSLNVTATTQNEIMMKSQFEANLNNIYVNSMDDLSKLQLHRDQLVSELSQFKHQIMATSPKSLEQYSNVKRLVDHARQQHQEERQKVANAYDENLQKLLEAKIEKFKKMYRQQYPDDTDEKLAAFDRAFKPIDDQYDQQLKHAKELARQGLINQFMIEHQSDPVLRAAFRFMAAKNNMESQYSANQAALEKMQPQQQQPTGYQSFDYQPQQTMSPADRLTQAQAAQSLAPDTDPFAADTNSSQSSQAAQPAAQAVPQQPAVTEQVPDLPDDDDQDADFDVLDAVNHDTDQAFADDSSAAPVGHVPDSDPDFADNSGEATDFTDPDDAVKQQAAELDHDSSDHSQADAALPDDHQSKQTVADDPDFPDDDDAALIDSLDDDPFEDVDDEPVQKVSKKSRGKSAKKKTKRNKSKRRPGSKFKKVVLGGAIAGMLSLGGLAGAAHLGLFNGGSGVINSKSELASSNSQQSKKAPKGTIKVGSILDVTVNGKQIRVKIVQVRSDGSAIGEASDGSRYAISAAQAKQAANAISHADKDANH